MSFYRPRLTLPAAIALVLIAVAGSSLHSPPAPPVQAGILPDEAIVSLAPELDALPNEKLSAYLGGRVAGRLPSLHAARLLLDDESADEAISRLQALDGVERAERNPYLSAADAPNDPLYVRQAQYLDQVGASAAWDLQRGRPSVIVAVLDTGVDTGHPDLAGALWTNAGELPDNGTDDDGNGCVDDTHGCAFVTPDAGSAPCQRPVSAADIGDDHGHGTFVSGIIAARGNNGRGISGIAPGVTLLPVKILDCHGRGTAFDAAAGLLYAARNGARVANISVETDVYSPVLAEAIRQAHADFNMVIVAAAGNAGDGAVRFPANLPETIAVASSGMPGDPDVRSSFSNWGPEVTVAAPGLFITSTVPIDYCDRMWLCLEDHYFAVASGTSFAAPLVSGLAALVLSETPGLSAAAVRVLIVATAQQLDDGRTPYWDGYGRIDAAETLRLQRQFLGTPVSTN